MTGWTYNAGRYVNDAGRALGAADLRDVRQTFVAAQKEEARGLSGLLARGELDRDQWESGMRQVVKETYIAQALLGKGGEDQMTPRDWGRVGAGLKAQYGFLGQFAGDTATLSEAQTAARAELYIASSNTAYSQARTEALGATDLPGQPGDDTECQSNCRCEWQIEDGLATWVSQEDASTCETCSQRASEWVDLPVGGPGEAELAVKGWVTLADGRHIDIEESAGAGSIIQSAPTSSQKAELARRSAKHCGQEVQRYSEEHNEPQLAAGLKGGGQNAMSLRDNEPVDVVVTKGGKITDGVELKTMTHGANDKITQQRPALERKAAWQQENGADFHTVVFDDRRVFNANGAGKHDESQRAIYYKRGAGSFRVSAMHAAADMAEVRRLIAMPKADLPAKARPAAHYEGVKAWATT